LGLAASLFPPLKENEEKFTQHHLSCKPISPLSSFLSTTQPLTHLVEQQYDALVGVQAAHVTLNIRAAAASRVTRVKHLHEVYRGGYVTHRYVVIRE
jgi:hypothetical protein